VAKLAGKEATPPTTLTVPREVAPLKNWMEPVGAPKVPSDMMVAVRVVV
jgi:hypothetical protein